MMRGFTLVELLVVLILAALIAGLMVPRFSQAIPSIQLRQATQETAAVLRAARTAAVTQAQEVAVVVDKDRNLVSCEATDEYFELPVDVYVEQGSRDLYGSQPVSRIVFAADGTSSGGVLKLATDRRSNLIAVDWLTGRVSIK